MRKPLLQLNHGEQGSVLIIVLWWLVILSIMAVALYAAVAPRIDLADKLKTRAQNYYLGRAAVKIAMAQVAADENPGFDALNSPWSYDETLFRDMQIGTATASLGYPVEPGYSPAENEAAWYGLEDEERRVNINRAGLETLRRLLQTAGDMEKLEAEPLAAAIADWRDDDDSPEKYGAEDSYYKTLSPPYECKDAPFEVVEELLLVKGMTTMVFKKIEPFVTVHGTGAVNINTASAAVLECLGFSPALAERIIRYRNGADGRPGTGDDLVLESAGNIRKVLTEAMALSRSEERELRNALNAAQLTVRSDNFRGHILRKLDNNRFRVQITFVFNRNGVLHSWHEF